MKRHSIVVSNLFLQLCQWSTTRFKTCSSTSASTFLKVIINSFVNSSIHSLSIHLQSNFSLDFLRLKYWFNSLICLQKIRDILFLKFLKAFSVIMNYYFIGFIPRQNILSESLSFGVAFNSMLSCYLFSNSISKCFVSL